MNYSSLLCFRLVLKYDDLIYVGYVYKLFLKQIFFYSSWPWPGGYHLVTHKKAKQNRKIKVPLRPRGILCQMKKVPLRPRGTFRQMKKVPLRPRGTFIFSFIFFTVNYYYDFNFNCDSHLVRLYFNLNKIWLFGAISFFSILWLLLPVVFLSSLFYLWLIHLLIKVL